MVAKLLVAAFIFVVVVIGVVALSFWYFNQKDERAHEKDLKQMEQTDRIMDIAEDESDLDAQLEREH